jgi:steroid delta-isomerase-like uncharacterized protein
MNSDPKALLRRWFEEVWNQGREATIDELFSDHAIAFGLGEADTDVRGPAQFKIFFRNIRGAFPDLHITIVDAIAEGDKVAVRFVLEGTHTGPGLPVPPTGRKVRVTGMTVVEVVDGMIIKGWNNWDQLGMLQQLGALPESSSADALLQARE